MNDYKIPLNFEFTFHISHFKFQNKLSLILKNFFGVFLQLRIEKIHYIAE